MRTVHKTYQDPQRAYPVGICSQCGRDLYPGSPCWRLCGQSLCGDCLLPWLVEELAAFRVRWEEARQ